MSTNLYVKDFPTGNEFRESDLLKLFKKFGEVIKVTIKRDENGASLGFGWVNFKLAKDAAEALFFF